MPVAHLPSDKEGRRNPEAAEGLVRAIVDALNPAIVAIPERELGDGILAGIRTTSAIRRSLSQTGRYPLLHLLGTGNPLSMLLLAAAGADLSTASNGAGSPPTGTPAGSITPSTSISPQQA